MGCYFEYNTMIELTLMNFLQIKPALSHCFDNLDLNEHPCSSFYIYPNILVGLLTTFPLT